MIQALVNIVYILLDVLFWIIVLQVIISWLYVFGVINPSSQGARTVVDVLDRITKPIYRPIRKILPDFGGLDLAPMVVIIGIMIMQRAILPGILAELGPTLVR